MKENHVDIKINFRVSVSLLQIAVLFRVTSMQSVSIHVSEVKIAIK